jgi:hypothetical protein
MCTIASNFNTNIDPYQYISVMRVCMYVCMYVCMQLLWLPDMVHIVGQNVTDTNKTNAIK